MSVLKINNQYLFLKPYNNITKLIMIITMYEYSKC